jgi:hypothetical protein
VAVTDAFLKGASPITIPANTQASILIDQGHLTTAFPEIILTGGAASQVTLHYAEALFTKVEHGVVKGNRNDIEGKIFLGPSDAYTADGGDHRFYRPLYWRTYRYIKLDIKTAAQPLVIEDLRGVFTGYPFLRKAQLQLPNDAADAETQRILDTGFRTARLCAHETYMDGPFYEQLQYAGDSRIQMMVSLYTSGDARLMKNGIELLNSSRTSEGATYSRAPSELQQYIPPFSLWWIGMVHDYWMYVDDPAFVKDMLTGVHSVLDFYSRYQKPAGSLLRMPWWNFVDWVKEWPNGEPLADADGSSAAALDLQLLMAYQWAADLENAQQSAGRRVQSSRRKTKRHRAGERLGRNARSFCRPTRPHFLFSACKYAGHTGARDHARPGQIDHAEGLCRCFPRPIFHLLPRLYECGAA